MRTTRHLRYTLKLKKRNKILLIVGLSLGLLLAVLSPKIETTEALRIVMLGDSLTAGFTWQEVFPTIKVHNFGVSGDTTKDILNRLEQVITLNPDIIFLQAGINDLGKGTPNKMESIMMGHLKVWGQLRQSLPETRLVITSLFPVRTTEGTDRFQGWNQAIRRLNSRIKVEAESQGLDFIDLAPALSDHRNQLNQEFTNDGLHLRKPAYKIWTEALSPFIEKEINHVR